MFFMEETRPVRDTALVLFLPRIMLRDEPSVSSCTGSHSHVCIGPPARMSPRCPGDCGCPLRMPDLEIGPETLTMLWVVGPIALNKISHTSPEGLGHHTVSAPRAVMTAGLSRGAGGSRGRPGLLEDMLAFP